MGQISAHLNPRPKGGVPSDIVENSNNDNAQCMAILTRSGKAVGSDVVKEDTVTNSKGKQY